MNRKDNNCTDISDQVSMLDILLPLPPGVKFDNEMKRALVELDVDPNSIEIIKDPDELFEAVRKRLEEKRRRLYQIG